MDLILLFIALLFPIVHGDTPQVFWGGYTTCAQNNCLIPISTSFPCELNDNICVCTTTAFVNQVAACMGQNCPVDSQRTYIRYFDSCSISDYPLVLNNAQWNTSASAGAASSVSQVASSVHPTTSSTGSPTGHMTPITSTPASKPQTSGSVTSAQSSGAAGQAPSASSAGNGYTEDQKINLGVGIGVGLGVGIPSVILAFLGYRARAIRRRK
ncbi:hypothetical protein BT63DRAFT_429440 [Microthyrium microscopicum]|uniref:CFEM domain-containing protein n=1 Tax=Microthyrium microscopicum TaxID=703497 RepID=A0A6A6TZT4_9PEZI|nr:hypothetical protein BT63DRAFT_429440 [Microthyrium microscopicum]